MELISKLQPRQIEAAEYWLDSETEEILYGGAKGGAKSYLGCSLIFGDALTYPGTHYFIARSELNDLKKFTTPSVYEVFEHWKIEVNDYMKFNGQDNYFDLHNGSKVFYLDCKYLPRDPEFHRFGSMQFTRGWGEEIGQMHPLALVNLGASIGRWKNEKYGLKRKMLLTANPHKGYGYINFYQPFKSGTLPEIRKFVKALPRDNKYLSAEYLESLNRLPKNERERLYLGNWEYDSDPASLLNYDDIEAMFTNDHLEQQPNDHYIICDVARYGSDRAIITVWKGNKLIDVVIFKTSSTVEIQNAITALRAKYKVPLLNVLIDDDGIGGGVTDNLNAIGFVNNSKPYNGQYQNLKSECGYKLAENIKDIYIEIILADKEIEMIKEELGMLKTFESDKDGKLRILPKEKIKEKLGRSPDWLDIFIMRMYYEVQTGRRQRVY